MLAGFLLFVFVVWLSNQFKSNKIFRLKKSYFFFFETFFFFFTTFFFFAAFFFAIETHLPFYICFIDSF